MELVWKNKKSFVKIPASRKFFIIQICINKLYNNIFYDAASGKNQSFLNFFYLIEAKIA